LIHTSSSEEGVEQHDWNELVFGIARMICERFGPEYSEHFWKLGDLYPAVLAADQRKAFVAKELSGIPPTTRDDSGYLISSFLSRANVYLEYDIIPSDSPTHLAELDLRDQAKCE